MKAVVGGGEPVGLVSALLKLRAAAVAWRPVVREGGGPVVLTLTLVAERKA